VVFLDPESTAGRAASHRSNRFGWTASPVLGHTRERPLAAVVADLMAQLAPIPTAEPPDGTPRYLGRCTCSPSWLASARCVAPRGPRRWVSQ
jgi:hypothetical protein